MQNDDSRRPPREGEPGLIRPYLFSDSAYDAGLARPGADVSAPRPYLMTAGRVPAHALAIETQIVATELGYATCGELEFETRHIVALCEEPLSLAEIGSRLDLPLGVVQVLVHDLDTLKLICIFIPDVETANHLDTIGRVINGLLALT